MSGNFTFEKRLLSQHLSWGAAGVCGEEVCERCTDESRLLQKSLSQPAGIDGERKRCLASENSTFLLRPRSVPWSLLHSQIRGAVQETLWSTGGKKGSHSDCSAAITERKPDEMSEYIKSLRTVILKSTVESEAASASALVEHGAGVWVWSQALAAPGSWWLQLLRGVFNAESQHDPKNAKLSMGNLTSSPEPLCGHDVVPPVL